MMLWLLLCPALFMVAVGDFGIETKYDELNNSFQGRMENVDNELDEAANNGDERNWLTHGSHDSSASHHWSGSSSSHQKPPHHKPPHNKPPHNKPPHFDSHENYYKKCKFNQYKRQHELKELKESNDKINAIVGIQASKLDICENNFKIAEKKELELKAALEKCTNELKALKLNLSKIKSGVASCESSQDKTLYQLADLREASALIKANNRVLIRDLEECDENEEHCSENLEECNFRCSSSVSSKNFS